MDFQKPLPTYLCHKTVGALKIKSIEADRKSRWIVLYRIDFEEVGYGPITMPEEWHTKHKPAVGGYLVVYGDGYSSFSPAKAFEDGYTLIAHTATTVDNAGN